MTSLEPPLPVPDDDDALDAAASALVDGVATPEEAALVAASPDGAARLAALRAVSEAVGRPGPQQSPSAAASALAAALAAFDAAGADATAAAAAGTPAPRLASNGETPGAPSSAQDEAGEAGKAEAIGAEEGRGNVRALRPGVGSPSAARWQPRLGAVAAALVLLIGVAVLTVNLLGQAAGPETATDLADAPTSAAARPDDTTGASAAARAEAAAVIDGGAFGNETAVEAIALRAAAAFDRPPVPASPDATPVSADLQRCLEAGPSTVTEEVGAPLYQAEGTFQGKPALAVAYQRDGDPPRVLLVLARSDCSLLERTTF